MPSRRTVLASGALAVTAVAGCTDRIGSGNQSTDDGTATPAPIPGSSEERTELAFGAVGPDGTTPVDATVQSSVRHVQNVDHNGIMAADAWYVFVTVERAPGGPAPGDFRLRTDTGEYEPLGADDDYRREQVGYVNGEPYTRADGAAGWLLFIVPYDDPGERARLVLDRTAWSLPTRARERLGADPPSFTLRAVDAPTEPARDEPFSVSLHVDNDGGRGTVRSAFNYTAPLYYPQPVSHAVAGGETVTLDVGVDVHLSGEGLDAGDEVAARVVSAGGEAEWSVTLS